MKIKIKKLIIIPVIFVFLFFLWLFLKHGLCRKRGCNGELCGHLFEDLFSPCNFHPSYGCYNLAKCELQKNLKCGWTITQEAQECFDKVPGMWGI